MRFKLKRVGLRSDKEKGVEERGARSNPSTGDLDATLVWPDKAAVAGLGTGQSGLAARSFSPLVAVNAK